MFCHLLTRTCRTSTAYATQSIRIVKRSLATAVSQRPPSPTDEVSTVATAPTRSLARRPASPPNQPQKVSRSPTIVAVHQKLRRAAQLVEIEHLIAAMVAAKPTFARWSLALRFLHLCPNLLLPNATTDRLQLMDRLLEYPGNNNEQFKLASSVWREFNACLDEAIRVEISKPNPCILKLRLDATSKGTHGSVILHLSSDSFARPPLSLSNGQLLVLNRINPSNPNNYEIAFGFVSSSTTKNKQGTSFSLTSHNSINMNEWIPSSLIEARILDLNLAAFTAMIDALKKFPTFLKFAPVLGSIPTYPKSPIPSYEINEETFKYNLLHPLVRLNNSQTTALKTALENTVTVVWGPPGTGKTRVITSLISLLLHTCPTKTILVTAPTHQAVDTILKQFLQAHERNPDFKASRRKLVRIGTHDTVDPAHWPYLPYNTVNDVETLDKRVYYSSIVFSTTLSAGVGVLATCKFDTVIVDEAAQVSQCATYIATSKARERIVLVGDEMQLGAVTSESRNGEQADGFQKSLFEVMKERGEAPVVLLDEQYRMPNEICEFSSRVWYNWRIKTHQSVDGRTPMRSAPFHGKKFVAFVDVAQGSECVTNSGSVENKEEAEAVKQVVEDLWRETGGGSGFGVISGYAAQVQLIQKVLDEVGINDVDVRTVDGFQGQERDVIVFSAVKTNGKIGFLKDYRRMNVMLTRAKRGIVIVGHSATLRKDPVWRQLLESIIQTKQF